MLTTSLDMRRAAVLRQDSGRPHVLPDQSKFGRNCIIMTQPAFSSTSLSTDRVESIQVTAAAWRAHGYEQEAHNLLIVAGLAAPAPAPAALPSNVLYVDFRARRQAVSR